MIEKLSMRSEPYGDWGIRQEAPSIFELMEKINEIIDKVNELDIKLHTVKVFAPTQDKAVEELLELLEKDNSVGEVIK